MGVAAYRIWALPRTDEGGLLAYGIQLFFNFFWPLFFFNLQNFLLAFVWLVLLWLAILLTFFRFRKRDRLAGRLLLPYLLWVAFAGYLNLGIFLLNR